MKANILVVDNHPLILRFLTTHLERGGYSVRTAEDGLSALEALESYTPDVVIVDLVMPNISGDKLCRIIRSMPELQDVPLVVLSAIAAEEDVDVSAFGASACIAKGPLDKMGQYVSTVLQEIEQGNVARLAGKTIGLDGVYVRKISEELLSSKRHAEAILENLSEGILELTETGKIIFANRAAIALIGIPEERLLASNLVDLFHEDHQPRVRRLLEEIHMSPREIPEDDPVMLSNRLFVLHLVEVQDNHRRTTTVIIDDVTERHRMKAQLQHARDMEAILAGAVAHDLNNILGGVVSYPELLLLRLPPDSPHRELIGKILDAGLKASIVVQDLLAMSQSGHIPKEVVDLNQVVSTYLDSAEHERMMARHPQVTLHTSLGNDLPAVEGSPVHLSKALMNLVFNAAEAVRGTGKISITTEYGYIDSPLRGYEDVPAGEYVILVVSDTGIGVSADDMERIFEPFFTKKVMGLSGSGLGMAVVRGAVKDHQGYINLSSSVGKGSTFTLFFPATHRTAPNTQPQPQLESFQGRGESILVVDDVEEQGQIAVSMLSELGYRVWAVSSGEAAVAHLRRESVDLVVLDMIMDHGIDGLETYRRILELHRGQRAIIVSGYSESGRVLQAQQLGAGAYVRKPLAIEKLGLAVRQELDRKDRSGCADD